MQSRAVIISDVHYSLSTLPLADAATRQAIAKANELDVPLIVSGDLHDTKGVLRGECVKAMIDTFKMCRHEPRILVGNHDRINEKSAEHSLEFLKPYARVINEATCIDGLYYIPYQHDPNEFIRLISEVPEGETVICHQGFNEANMGDYVQDKSAVSSDAVGARTVITGHYHRAQTIYSRDGSGKKLGSISYVGNPYTISFGESSDGPKGFQVLGYGDGLTFYPTNLRRHRVFEIYAGKDELVAAPLGDLHGDLVWIKYYAHGADLRTNKRALADKLGIPHTNFKLDIIPVSEDVTIKKESKTDAETLDALIEATREDETNKKYLKELWRKLSA